MKTVLNVLSAILIVISVNFITGCAEPQYYRVHHEHSARYYSHHHHHHHHRYDRGIDIEIRN